MSSLSPADISPTHPANNHGDELVLGGRRFALSQHAAKVLGDLVAALESGQSVETQAVDEYLSTQQVADILGISRPSVVRLLHKGELPYEQPSGVHRRILRSELDRYRANRAAERHAALQDLAETFGALDAEMDGFVSTR